MKSIEWRNGKIRFLDQTRLPVDEITIETDDVDVVAEAIRALRIRGAPLIGIAAAYGVALAAAAPGAGGTGAPRECADRAIGLLAGTRPTAVNLFAALDRMRAVLDTHGDPGTLAGALLDAARALHAEDAAMCAAIGNLGAALLPDEARVITHCNAGMLATGGIGTAIGIITTAAAQGKIRKVFVGETRPLYQGARLTSWELREAGIDVTVMTDSAVPYLMARQRVDAVIIGADRIAANGDVANKIGSYALARAASAHGIPFYVAAPRTTIDPSCPDGDRIPIEERGAGELADSGTRGIVPRGVSVWTPAFDVTPHEFISAIITESGVHRPPYDFRPSGVSPPADGAA
jgi:methylthioribose-1-phosphate isomerase